MIVGVPSPADESSVHRLHAGHRRRPDRFLSLFEQKWACDFAQSATSGNSAVTSTRKVESAALTRGRRRTGCECLRRPLPAHRTRPPPPRRAVPASAPSHDAVTAYWRSQHEIKTTDGVPEAKAVTSGRFIPLLEFTALENVTIPKLTSERKPIPTRDKINEIFDLIELFAAPALLALLILGSLCSYPAAPVRGP